MNQTSRIRLNTPLLPILSGVLLFLQWLTPYDGWLILLVGLGGAWLAGYAWVRLLAGQLSIRREMRYGWAQVGDLLEERFTLTNQSWLPAVWIEIQDHSTMPDYQVSRVTGISGQSVVQWYTQGQCTRRGLFTFGPTSLRTADPLGIFTLEIHNPRSATMLITPPIVPLPQIQVAAGGRSGEGRPRPNAPEPTVSSSGVREYLPGDSLRWVHWRTTARRDRPYVRLFEGTPAGDWWLLVDLDAAVQAGHGRESTEEAAVILAASLADRGLRDRHPVGLAINSRTPTWLAPRDGDGQRWDILRLLALASPGATSLADTLKRLKTSFGRRTSLVVITPNTGGEWIESLIPLVWSGIVPTVLLLEPETFGGSGVQRGNLEALAGLGVARYPIGRDLLDRPEAQPGHAGQWEWHISPTGRAIPGRKPIDLEWKTLS